MKKDAIGKRKKTETVTITDLSRRISAREEQIEHAKRGVFSQVVESIKLAILQGEDLIEAKAMLPRGEWLPWLGSNFTFTERTARRYIALAIHFRTHKSDFELAFGDAASIRQAYIAAGIFPESETPEDKPMGSIETWRLPFLRLRQKFRDEILKTYEPAVLLGIEQELQELLAKVKSARG